MPITIDELSTTVTGAATNFYGKFRGTVTDTNDPLMMGRVRARVPDVFGNDESGWAMPCAPFGGDQTGFFAVPAVGAGVWIEFEHGDPEYPIWAGCWWGSVAEMPPSLLAPPPPSKKVLIRTEGGHSILLDDTPGTGGITLETAGGQKIVMTALGIEINDGQGATIKLTGPQVSINDGAIEVI
ncbi:MAG: phage baseplate assembly protein V [Acidobacteriota bacterium]|nr:phage baseplate assembly protein V [Acidobacteriota bacterium]